MPSIRVGAVIVPINGVRSSTKCTDTLTTTYFNYTDGTNFTTTETINKCGDGNLALTLGLALGIGLGVPICIVLCCLAYRRYWNYMADKRLGQRPLPAIAEVRPDPAPHPPPLSSTIDMRTVLKNAAYLDYAHDRVTDNLKGELHAFKAAGGSLEDVLLAARRDYRLCIVAYLERDDV
jgi:hypothetical protein